MCTTPRMAVLHQAIVAERAIGGVTPAVEFFWHELEVLTILKRGEAKRLLVVLVRG